MCFSEPLVALQPLFVHPNWMLCSGLLPVSWLRHLQLTDRHGQPVLGVLLVFCDTPNGRWGWSRVILISK